MTPTTTVEGEHVVVRWPLADVVRELQHNVAQNTDWVLRENVTAYMVKQAIRTTINDEAFRPVLIETVREALKVEAAALAKRRLSRPGVLDALFDEAKGGDRGE